MVKERPILFTGEMVRAILDGRKTQTRRVVKPQPTKVDEFKPGTVNAAWQAGFVDVECPYGVPGDRLWVRETWRMSPADGEWVPGVRFKAGGEPHIKYPEFDDLRLLPKNWQSTRWRPSIHMPKWASRITLEVVSVRVERVQAITIDDIRAEGAITEDWEEWREDAQCVGLPMGSHIENERDVFEALWDSINSKRGFGWDANPWVWVVEFKVMP